MSIRPWFWVIQALLIGAACGGDPPSGIPGWIAQLGAERFQDREEAGRKLWEAGTDAVPALRNAAESSDPEVRRRAELLLRRIGTGERPDWPEELAREVAEMEALDEDGRKALYARVAERDLDAEVAFLLARLDFRDAPLAAARLKERVAEEKARREVMERLREPEDELRAGVLAAASLASGGVEDLLRAHQPDALSDADRRRLRRAALEGLKTLHGDKEFDALLIQAALWAGAAPDDTRFQLMEALGVAHAGDDEGAKRMAHRAMDRNAGREDLLFRDGELMGDLGHVNIAKALWGRVLKTDPEGSVYDANAYMRYGEAYEREGEPGKAAFSFRKGLEALRALKARGNGGVGANVSEEELEARIARLESRAAGDGEVSVQVGIESRVVDDRREELLAMGKRADVTMRMSIQPYGLRLFEVAPVTLLYDRESGAYEVRLNQSSALAARKGKLPAEGVTVLVHALDRRYVYEVDGETGLGRRTHLFDIDYRITVEPDDDLVDWTDCVITIGDKTHTWEELKQGLPYDMLPETLELDIEGKTPGGERKSFRMKLEPAKLEAGKTKF